MLKWERYFCSECSLVWERNLDGAWRYMARIAVPMPSDRKCPLCAARLHMHWVRPLPVLLEEIPQQ